MNSLEIATVFASTLYRHQNTWNAIKDDMDFDFGDAALNRDMKKQLRSLTEIVETSDRDSIYEALEVIGRHNALEYMNNIAGSQELKAAHPFLLACKKLGKPDEAWETLENELAELHSVQLMNPQHFLPSYEEMGKFLRQDKPEPESFPHTKDSFAFRRALGAGLLNDGEYKNIAIAYVEYALNTWDQESKAGIEPDRQAELAVLLEIGGAMLPRNGYDENNHDPYHSTLPSQIIATIGNNPDFSESELQQLVDIQKRVAKFSQQSEMFANPLKFALDYYTGKEQQVLRDLVVGSRQDVLPSPSV